MLGNSPQGLSRQALHFNIFQLKLYSSCTDGSSISLPGAVAYEENNDITQIV
jgi:hypothetical protein